MAGKKFFFQLGASKFQTICTYFHVQSFSDFHVLLKIPSKTKISLVTASQHSPLSSYVSVHILIEVMQQSNSHEHSQSNMYYFLLQGVPPASFEKVIDPKIKHIINGCICTKKEDR